MNNFKTCCHPHTREQLLCTHSMPTLKPVIRATTLYLLWAHLIALRYTQQIVRVVWTHFFVESVLGCEVGSVSHVVFVVVVGAVVVVVASVSLLPLPGERDDQGDW